MHIYQVCHGKAEDLNAERNVCCLQTVGTSGLSVPSYQAGDWIHDVAKCVEYDCAPEGGNCS